MIAMNYLQNEKKRGKARDGFAQLTAKLVLALASVAISGCSSPAREGAVFTSYNTAVNDYYWGQVSDSSRVSKENLDLYQLWLENSLCCIPLESLLSGEHLRVTIYSLNDEGDEQTIKLGSGRMSKFSHGGDLYSVCTSTYTGTNRGWLFSEKAVLPAGSNIDSEQWGIALSALRAIDAPVAGEELGTNGFFVEVYDGHKLVVYHYVTADLDQSMDFFEAVFSWSLDMGE